MKNYLKQLLSNYQNIELPSNLMPAFEWGMHHQGCKYIYFLWWLITFDPPWLGKIGYTGVGLNFWKINIVCMIGKD